MLTRDPKQRPSARDMLAHPWIATAGGDAGANAVVHTPEVLQRIRSFAAMDRLKKHAALVRRQGVLAHLCAGLCWKPFLHQSPWL